jgi:two-component sensor histidine kinase
MFKGFRFGRAQAAVYALAAFALIALFAWRAEALYAERARLLKSAENDAATMALGTAGYVDRTIDVAELLSDSVRKHVARRGGLAADPPDELRGYIAALANETTMRDYLMVVDDAGHPVVLSERTPPPGISFADRDWFRAIQRGASAYIGPAVVSRLGRNIIYTYSKKLNGSGIVDVSIQSSTVKPPDERSPGEALAQVWTADGRMIVANFMTFDARGNAKLPKAPFAAPVHGAGFLRSPDRDLIIAYQRATDRALIATVTVRRSEILAPWWRRVWLSVTLFGLLAIVIAWLVWFITAILARDTRRRRELEQSTTALAQAVAQRDTLLREIHHRVKNNLQVTSSLIEMQARQFDDEAVRIAFKRTQQRLYAIGMVHDVLYGEQGVSIIDMQAYLTRLCHEIAHANGTRERKIDMTLDIAPVMLPAEMATSLGLCVSEVLVNAFKHAFPPGGGGAILVRLTQIAQERAELLIHDNGHGMAPPEGGKSLGMRLIRAFAAQLGGAITFETEGGTTFRLNFAIERPEDVAAQ